MNIEGLPLGVKAVRWGRPKVGEYILAYGDDFIHKVVAGTFAGGNYLIIAPDNDYKVMDLSKVPVPEEYEWTGEFRHPKNYTELFLSVKKCEAVLGRSVGRRMILRKKKKKYIVIKYPVPDNTPLGKTDAYHPYTQDSLAVSKEIIEE